MRHYLGKGRCRMNPVYLVAGGLFFPCFQLLTIRRLMNAFFHIPRRTPIRYAAWIAYYLLLAVSQLGTSIPPSIFLMLNALLIFAACTFSCQSSIGNRCIFSILVLAVWMMTEVAIGIILSLIGLDGWGLSTAGIAISNVLMFAGSVMARHYAKGTSRPDLSVQYMLAVAFIPIGTIFLMHHIFMIVAEHMEYSAFAISSSFILLLLNYTAFEVYEQMTKDASAQERNRLYERELEFLNRQTEEQEAYDRQTRQMRHDMKNHMTGLLGMLHDGTWEQMEEYILFLLQDTADCRLQDISRSGNAVVDAIVNHKYCQADREGIEFDANVFLPSILPFRAGHLAIVFGNLLDNALEACRDMKDGKQWIRMEAVYTKEVLMVSVYNSCPIRKRDRNGQYATTKNNRRTHGLRLFSVEQAVEPYHGLLDVEYEDRTFHATVVMYGCYGEK